VDYEAFRFECLQEMDCDLKPHSQEFRGLDKKIKESTEDCKSDFRVIGARENANFRTVVDKEVFDSIAVADMDNAVDARVVD
ncbi:hypothetical protein ROZALSC1DRAFT_31005, partial [Rozella allomycis CSF55]